MLLWAGIFLIVLGVACVAIDRPAVHFIYDHVSARFHNFLSATTHLAKAAHWLVAACIVVAATWAWLHWIGENAGIRLALQLALLAGCAGPDRQLARPHPSREPCTPWAIRSTMARWSV